MTFQISEHASDNQYNTQNFTPEFKKGLMIELKLSRNKALSSSSQMLQNFLDSLSYRILRHMHRALNKD